MSAPVPVTVVVPTVGRMEMLAQCLESLARCDPRPAEIVVVDQSGGAAVAEATGRYASMGARAVRSAVRGIPRAANLGVREAQHRVVLFTHDDCTVDPAWAGATWGFMSGRPSRIVTGRVVPAGDGSSVPSTITDTAPRDYTGERQCAVLYANNMAASRAALLEMGGFDERFRRASEDCDLCYRWLRAGYELLFRPELIVRHHDWRSPGELRRLSTVYWRAQGNFYAKHLRAGDAYMLRFLADDLSRWRRSAVSGVRRERPPWDVDRGVLPWVAVGVAQGLWLDTQERVRRSRSRPRSTSR